MMLYYTHTIDNHRRPWFWGRIHSTIFLFLSPSLFITFTSFYFFVGRPPTTTGPVDLSTRALRASLKMMAICRVGLIWCYFFLVVGASPPRGDGLAAANDRRLFSRVLYVVTNNIRAPLYKSAWGCHCESRRRNQRRNLLPRIRQQTGETGLRTKGTEFYTGMYNIRQWKAIRVGRRGGRQTPSFLGN